MLEGSRIEHAEGPKAPNTPVEHGRILGKRRALASQFPDFITHAPYDITRKLPKRLKHIVEKPIDAVVGFFKSHDLTSGTQTRETKIPGTEIDRGIVTRFQRAEIARAYRPLRSRVRDAEKRGGDITPYEEDLNEFRIKAHALERDLDTLNRQFYENQTIIQIDDPELGHLEIPVVTLDLNPPAEGQEDARTPYFIVPTYVTNPHESASFSMALASSGEEGKRPVVKIMTYPEKFKMAKTPEDWIEKVKKRGGLDIYADLVKKIVQGLDLRKPNLVGISMGAAVSLELATDPSFPINDLIIVEPPTVIDKGTLKQLFDFGVIEGVPAILNAEDRAKVVLSESPELAVRMPGTDSTLAPILAHKRITQEMLRAINPSGKYQVWFGENSAITGEKTRQEFLDAEHARLVANPDAKPIEMFVIKGGKHGSAAIHAEGVTSIIVENKPPAQTITELDINDLENSAARFILNRT